jgi:hypothetical protein
MLKQQPLTEIWSIPQVCTSHRGGPRVGLIDHLLESEGEGLLAKGGSGLERPREDIVGIKVGSAQQD